MKTLTYKPDLSKGIILKTNNEQHNFFSLGHPCFLIPDFSNDKCDIWFSFMDYLEKINGEEIYDQDGGEIVSHEIINFATGLTKCKYIAYVQLRDDKPFEDIEVEIEGYVIARGGELYFAATKVIA